MFGAAAFLAQSARPTWENAERRKMVAVVVGRGAGGNAAGVAAGVAARIEQEGVGVRE